MKCSLSFMFLSFLFVYLVFVGFSGAQSGLAELLEAVEDSNDDAAAFEMTSDEDDVKILLDVAAEICNRTRIHGDQDLNKGLCDCFRRYQFGN
ncbi:Hypothetical predicted protein [Paramuricea clavata]|uniref:Uncharacterized protein n=1 Tax=Paramuricea clavata TaxID=317549 RepID=A0A6S7JMA7_PARCT|nr:Hypothetical predicted protein [Paramuricea clavata]